MPVIASGSSVTNGLTGTVAVSSGKPNLLSNNLSFLPTGNNMTAYMSASSLLGK